jgi:tRNA threonylcarbamoyladenosine biosynthesis protein TsaE
MRETYTTQSEEETISLGSRFARRLAEGDVVALYGELGVGKTQFVKGVCTGLGVKEMVASPSFIIMNEYKGSRNGLAPISVFHFDFYRVKSQNEVHDLGIEEYFSGRGICLVEWAEVAKPLLPSHRYDITFRMLENLNAREILIEKLS